MTVETTSKESLTKLLDHDLNNMVASIATTYYKMYRDSDRGSLIEQEDLEGEGFAAVAIAYESFDPSRGKFRTWAFPYINKAMTNFCLKFRHPLSISEKAARFDMPSLMDIGVMHLNWPDEDGNDFDIPIASGIDTSNETIEYFFHGLNKFEQKLLKEHFLDGYSLQEVALRHNLCKSQAGTIIRRLRDRMQSRIKEYVENC